MNTNSIRAGRAFVELFADDSKLRRTLDETKARVRSFGTEVNAIGKRVGSGASGLGEVMGGFGKLGGIARVGGAAGATGAAAYLAWDQTVKLIRDAEGAAEKFNQKMTRTGEMYADIAAIRSQAHADTLAKAGGMNLADRGKFATDELRKAKDELRVFEDRAAAADKRMLELSSGWNQAVKRHLPGFSQELEENKQKLGAHRQYLSDQTKQLKEFVRELEQAKKEGGFTAAFPAVKATNDELQVQLATLNMTADEARLYRMELDAIAKGMPVDKAKELLGVTRELLKDLEQAQKYKAVNDEMKALAQGLEFDLRTAGKTPEEVQLLKLQETGQALTDPNLAGLIAMKKDAERLQQLITALPKEQEIKSAVKGTFGGFLGGGRGVQMLGTGENTGIPQKQLTQQEITNKKLEDLRKAVRQLDTGVRVE